MGHDLRESSEVGLYGDVLIEVRDLDGNLLETREGHNLVVDAGRNLLRDLLAGDQVSGITHVAVGTNPSTPAVGHTALFGEVGRFEVTNLLKSEKKLTVKLFIPTNALVASPAYVLREAAILNASSAGVMYSRFVFEGITKTSGITVTLTWDLTWS